MTAIASSAVNLCDGTIRYDRSSESDSVVVLLHGGGLDNARLSWRHLLPALADVHRVYAPDWPKHGSSRPWRGIVDQAGLERCLGHLLDRWGLRSVALVGVSMGASAALGFTLAHPERVDRLVLLDPGGLQESVRMHLLSYLAVQAPWPRLTALALRPWVLRRLIQRSTFATPPADVEEIAAGVIEELRAKRNRSPYSDWQRCEIGPHRMKVNFMACLGQIDIATLVVHGAADRLVPVEIARESAQRIPNAHLHVIDGCGHWSPRERPAEVNAAVREFLS